MLQATLFIVLFVYGYGEEMNRRTAEKKAFVLQKRFEDLRMEAGINENDLQNRKNEIAKINRQIRKLNQEIENVKSQRAALEAAIIEAEERDEGEAAVKDAKQKLTEQEPALQKAMLDLAQRIRNYEKMMVKQALDIEIASYKNLLEEE